MIIWGIKEKKSNIDTVTITGVSLENKTNILKQKKSILPKYAHWISITFLYWKGKISWSKESHTNKYSLHWAFAISGGKLGKWKS